jgi:hypothetical protein
VENPHITPYFPFQDCEWKGCYRHPSEAKVQSHPSIMLKRIAVCICGVGTVLVARLFGRFKHLAPPQANWSAFHGVLLAVGILAIIISLVPAALVRKVRLAFTDERRFPTAFVGGFAAIGFAAALILALIPVTRNPSMTAFYCVCPACIATATVDPSFATVICVLAPLNAAIFGAFGGVLGAVLRLCRG